MIKKDLSNTDYHADPAIGSTTLKYGLVSMAKLKAKLSGLIPNKSSAAMDMGTVAHSAVLEQDISGFVVGPNVKTKASKEWKAFVKEHEDKIVLKPEEHANLVGMYDAFFKHPLASRLIKDGNAELSVFQDIKGTAYKARFDYVVDKGETVDIIDYKTAADCSPDAFSKAIYNYRYDISAAHYIELGQTEFKKQVGNYFWIVQEKEAPYEIAVYRADADLLRRGHKKVWKLYDAIEKAKETDAWPGREAKILDLDIPSYAANLEEAGDE